MSDFASIDWGEGPAGRGEVDETSSDKLNKAARRAKAGRKERGRQAQALAVLAGQVRLLTDQNREYHRLHVQFAEAIGKVFQAVRPLIDELDRAFPDVDAMDDRDLAFAIRECRRVVLAAVAPRNRTPEEQAAVDADGPPHTVEPAEPERESEPREASSDG